MLVSLVINWWFQVSMELRGASFLTKVVVSPANFVPNLKTLDLSCCEALDYVLIQVPTVTKNLIILLHSILSLSRYVWIQTVPHIFLMLSVHHWKSCHCIGAHHWGKLFCTQRGWRTWTCFDVKNFRCSLFGATLFLHFAWILMLILNNSRHFSSIVLVSTLITVTNSGMQRFRCI